MMSPPIIGPQPTAPGKTVARSRDFVVAAGHPKAAEAAVAAYHQGGSLVDAALTASAVLTVILPHATSIGGDLLALVYNARSGCLLGLDAAGTAPALATPEHFTPTGLPQQGTAAAVVPGLVAGWGHLHQRFGRRPWAGLLQPAIDLAAGGFVPSSGLREFLAECAPALERDSGSRSLFLHPLSGPRDLLEQAALARTLDTLAVQGPSAFYHGAIGQAIDEFMRSRAGLIRSGDLAAYQPRWVSPLRSRYRGHELAVLPPTSFGLLLPLQLATLEKYAVASLSDEARFALQLRAMQAAFTAGEPYLHDAHAAMSQEDFERLKHDARTVFDLSGNAMPADGFGGTACVVAADAEGNMVVLVQSIFQPFGAACADPATGIVFNNRMAGFRLEGDNAVGPGKRPAHTLSPTLVFHNGEPRWALATPGGVSQTVTLAQVASRLIDLRDSIADAVDAPRWCLSRMRSVLLEPRHPAAELGRRHPERFLIKDDPYSFGSVKLVERDGSRLQAYADQRRNAAALAG